jgi:asparagine synthetase B (glutamine-hydrolysing)
MGRDHLGVKPLFYAQRGSAILFGSELKAIHLKALQDWTQNILHNANLPILPLIDTATVDAFATGKMPLPTDREGIALFERIIQLDSWLKDYHVTIC